MNYMDFQPHLIRERNEQMRGEFDSLRLQEQLRKDRGSSGSRFVVLCRMGVMPLLRAAKVSLTTKVARVAMVLVALVAALAALQALSAQPTQASSFSKIAFESQRNNNWDIYTMNSDGTGLRRITFNSTADRAPSISADGSKIAYTSFPEHQLSGEIYTMNSDGSGQRRLTFTSTPDFAPSISADGSKIAFESQRNNNWDIYTMNSDGTGLRRITFSSASDTQPSLSPDGNKIVYISDMDNARGEIYSIPLVGFPNITTRLTFGDGAARAPSVSTSGKIAYSYPSQLGRIGAQNWDIFTMNSDGTGKTRLTFGPADDYAPSLSPGASTIHYESDRDQDTREIYRMNSDGTGHTRLTFNSVPDTNAG